MKHLFHALSALCLLALTTACYPDNEIPGGSADCDRNTIIPDLNDTTPPEGFAKITVQSVGANGRPMEQSYNLTLPASEPVTVQEGNVVHMQIWGSDFTTGTSASSTVMDLEYSCDINQGDGIYQQESGILIHSYDDTSTTLRCVPVSYYSPGFQIHAAGECATEGYNTRGKYSIYHTLKNYAHQSITYLLEIQVVERSVTTN